MNSSLQNPEGEPEAAAVPREELQRLRGCLRDLLAVSSLRAVWRGWDPPAIGDSLADAMLAALNLELVFVRIGCPPRWSPADRLRTASGALPTPSFGEVAEIVDAWDAASSLGPLSILEGRQPGGRCRAVVPLGQPREFGFLVAESLSPSFPDELERAVLTIGANQAAVALKERQLLEQRLEELALREREELFRGAFDYAAVGAALATPEGRFQRVNPALCRITGYAEEDLLATDARLITAPDNASTESGLTKSLLAGEIPGLTFEKRYAHKNGAKVWTQTSVSLLPNAGDKTQRLVALVQDVSDRKQAEGERDALARRLVHLQEEERRDLARELHDEVGQLLTGLGLMVEGVEAALPPEGSRDATKAMKKLVTELIGKVRDRSCSLRPPMLDDLGLKPTLLWQVERIEEQAGLQVDLRCRNLDRRFRPEIELAAFRIVQEALTNVARHAGVKAVRVDVHADGERLTLRVEDAGRGFDVDATLARYPTGLSGMRERCRLLGGRLQIDSEPRRGTRLFAELPLAAPTDWPS